jgi:hypothetical protein
MQANGRIAFGVYNGASQPVAVSTTAVNNGKWCHLVGVRVGRTLIVYVNGVMENSNPNGNTVDIGNAYSTIGASRNPSVAYPLNGAIFDVRIYNRALTAAEIAAIYRGVQ